MSQGQPGGANGGMELTEERQRALTQLMSAWLGQRDELEGDGERWVQVRQAELLRAGRPAVVDVLCQVDERMAHAVLGVRRPGEEQHFMTSADDSVLGLLEDDDGLGVVVDALHDAQLAPLVLAVVAGDQLSTSNVAPIADDQGGVVLAFDDRCSLTVFPWLADGPHPGVALLVALDEAGFNHLAAPLALWRRGGRDLGVVQELLSGMAGGWALALTSLRDLYASGGRPEDAGGDFGPEALALGTMTARMHLALDRAFGRESIDVADLVDEVEAAVQDAEPAVLEGHDGQQAAGVLDSLRTAGVRCPVLHTHGDFHLGRTARTDPGWVVADFMPGGIPPGGVAPVPRSPLADVADMLWSLHHVASVAASERDPTGRAGLAQLARAWETRNRRAFFSGYLETPGIGGLVPGDRTVVRNLAGVFELERAAGRAVRPARS